MITKFQVVTVNTQLNGSNHIYMLQMAR